MKCRRTVGYALEGLPASSVRREIVGDHANLFATRLVGNDVAEEGDELGGGVSGGGLAQHFAGLGIEGGVDESVPCR